jgi:hypothetical protein
MSTPVLARKVRATVDFRPTNPEGHFASWHGTVVSMNGNPVLDRHTGNPARYICRITAIPVDQPKHPNDYQFRLVTQGSHKSSRRYRHGTFAEMVEVAEKWAAQRFYSEAVL